jgi:hypothetical protein
VGELLARRLRGRPVGWVRRATLRERQQRHPAELLVAGGLRTFARQLSLEQVWERLPATE